MVVLENDKLKVSIQPYGAEVRSIYNKLNHREYLWDGNEKYWKFHSPLLFPFIGSNWGGKYRVDDKEYTIEKHGWARFREFNIIQQTSDKVAFNIVSNADTKVSYPYDFDLVITYTLKDWELIVDWRVVNPSDQTMWFQIGGHPGFNYVDFKEEDKVKAYFRTNCSKINYKLVGDGGCLNVDNTYTLEAPDGIFEIRPEMFDNDALIIEETPLKWIQLLDKNKVPFVTLEYDFPVTGIWSPAGLNAPFVCIEPWYGCCDRQYYNGDITHKDYINSIAPHQKFEANYKIRIEYN